MKQLITRLDEELHDRLKARARAEGVSVNAFVTNLLRAGLAEGDDRARLRLRMDAADLNVVPRRTRGAPSREAAIRSTHGAGRVVSEALEAERRTR